MIPLRLGILGVAMFLLSACAMGHKVDESPASIEGQKRDAQYGIFSVKGCVYHPGKYYLKSGQTLKLSEALKRAGGTINGSYFDGERSAYLSDIRVRRIQNDSIIEFKLDTRNDHSGNDFIIEPGDLIYVPELL